MVSKKFYISLAAILSLVTALGLYNVDRGLKNLNTDFRKKVKTEQPASLEASILDRTPEQSSRLLEQILKNPLKSDEGILYKTVDEIIESYGEAQKSGDYKNILSRRKKLEKIASKYSNVNLPLLMAVIKAENPSFNYNRSKAGAVGPMQVLYNGSYAFLWNALFNNNPYFASIRSNYENQLNEISSELNDNNILVKGKQGKQKTWKNLKAYFRNHPSLNENIGTFYLDFLIGKFGVEKGIAAYNAGETRVRNANGIPNIKETRRYVEDVIKAAEVFSSLLTSPNVYLTSINK